MTIRVRARYRRLVREVAADALKVCVEFERQFDEYEAAELAGENVAVLYPLVWAHLRDCIHCQRVYRERKVDQTE